MIPTIDALAGLPQMELTVGDRTYHVSELTMAAAARLQAIIKQRKPHPVDVLEPIVADMPATLQNAAYWETIKPGLAWPPRYGSSEGLGMLLDDLDGQGEILREGLLALHPEITVGQARRIIEDVAARDQEQGVKGKGTLSRAFAIMFGVHDPNRDDQAKRRRGTQGGPVELSDLAKAAERILKMRRADWLQYTPGQLAYLMSNGEAGGPGIGSTDDL